MNSLPDYLIAGTILIVAIRLFYSAFFSAESILFWTPAAYIHRRFGAKWLKIFLILSAMVLLLLSAAILRRGRAAAITDKAWHPTFGAALPS